MVYQKTALCRDDCGEIFEECRTGNSRAIALAIKNATETIDDRMRASGFVCICMCVYYRYPYKRKVARRTRSEKFEKHTLALDKFEKYIERSVRITLKLH